MKYETITKTNNFEKLVRKLTRIIKKHTKLNDKIVIMIVDRIMNMIIIKKKNDVNTKILHALVYLYTTSEIEKMNRSNKIIIFLKNIFLNKRWKRNPEVAQQQIVTRSQI